MKSPVLFSFDRSTLVGLALMAFALLFWLAVLLEVAFHQPFLIESVFVPIDRFSAWLSISGVVVLPALAVLLNIVPLLKVEFHDSAEQFLFTLEIKKRPSNALVVLIGLFMVMAIMLYSFVENFVVLAR